MGAKSSKPKESNQIVKSSPTPVPLPVLTRQMILNIQRSVLKGNYIRAENNFEEAPAKLAKAEKEYIVFDKGETYYTEKQEQKYTNEAKEYIKKEEKEFLQDLEKAKNVVSEYDSLLYYENNLDELVENQANEINKYKKSNSKIKNNRDKNYRMAYYYEQNVDKNKRYVDIMRKIYWVFLLLYIVIIMILQRKYEDIKKNKLYWIGLVLFALFPFVVSWISKILESKL